MVRAGLSRRLQHGLHGAAPQNQPRFQRPHAALPQAGYFTAQSHLSESFKSVWAVTVHVHLCFRQWHQHLYEATDLQTWYLFFYCFLVSDVHLTLLWDCWFSRVYWRMFWCLSCLCPQTDRRECSLVNMMSSLSPPSSQQPSRLIPTNLRRSRRSTGPVHPL